MTSRHAVISAVAETLVMAPIGTAPITNASHAAAGIVAMGSAACKLWHPENHGNP
jgi:hypothetical protein